jgi:hypothetical protein
MLSLLFISLSLLGCVNDHSSLLGSKYVHVRCLSGKELQYDIM